MKLSVYSILFLLLAASCTKEEAVEPVFEVSTPKTTYKVNEIITFNFTGNPDVISFFSGENGKRYAKYGRDTAIGIPKLAFTSVRAQGTQPNSLQVMVSSDFPGIGTDSAATVSRIGGATWKDITDRAVLSTGASVASGSIDLTDIAEGGKPVFIAFKYTGTSGTVQNKWTISGLTVTNNLADGTTYTVANLGSAAIANYGVSSIFSPGWVGYKVSGNYNWVISSTLVITGASSAAVSTSSSEAWAFSGPINLNKVGGDVGTAIKEGSSRLDNYNYTFTTPGEYTVTFRAANTNVYGSHDVIKQLKLTITP